jgi:endoglucanase Acf2
LPFLAEYPSVRGKMKLMQGKGFRTSMKFPGVLPGLPGAGDANKEKVVAYLKPEVESKARPLSDTYGDGKWLGKTATLAALAEIYGQDESAKSLRESIRKRLEEWLTAVGEDGKPKSRGLFDYDSRWGTLIGYPASFGSDVELNDHHFHYGYFIQAAAEIARHDPGWAKDDRFGGMVKLLIRDIASADRKDALFPFLRNFDPYAGHSWASGHAKFGDGNNHESSSEAMNAWTGMILWGQATGDNAIRDLGIWLYTTEMNAINEYWFDVYGDNFPKSYPASVITMVWGGKGANATWFSADPAMVHGINWLPFHGGSLYLGQFPTYVEKNYAALVAENGGTNFKAWSDLIWMYRALSDPADAIKQFEAGKDKLKVEDGNSKAHTAHWLYTLDKLGRVDTSVTADYPLYAVLFKGKTQTYCAYNMSGQPRTVVFSDGFQLKLEPRSWGTGQKHTAGAEK